MRDDQVRRYARHVLLPEVGGIGQRRLFAATAVVRRAVGPGAAAVAYLAAAGVGTLVVADAGVVAAPDVLFEEGDVGRPVVEAVRDRVAALNPDVRVQGAGEGDLVEPEPVDAGDAAGELLAGARAALAFIARATRA